MLRVPPPRRLSSAEDRATICRVFAVTGIRCYSSRPPLQERLLAPSPPRRRHTSPSFEDYIRPVRFKVDCLGFQAPPVLTICRSAFRWFWFRLLRLGGIHQEPFQRTAYFIPAPVALALAWLSTFSPINRMLQLYVCFGCIRLSRNNRPSIPL